VGGLLIVQVQSTTVGVDGARINTQLPAFCSGDAGTRLENDLSDLPSKYPYVPAVADRSACRSSV
jgi:hypothetical protein